jgi:hypothetical protein
MLKFIDDRWRDILGLTLVVTGLLVMAFLPSIKDAGLGCYSAGFLAMNLKGNGTSEVSGGK